MNRPKPDTPPPNDVAEENGLEDKLTAAMEQYLSLVESGVSIDRDAFLSEYPDCRDQLSAAMQSMDFLNGLVSQESEQSGRKGLATEAILATDSVSKDAEELGDFRLLREIGRGGMGVVYEAEQRSLGRRVALKVLPFAALLDERQLERFKNEARAAAMLRHPNIVNVFQVGCERGIHFYAMDLVNGPNLAEVMTRTNEAGEKNNSSKRSDVDTPHSSVHSPSSPCIDTTPFAQLSTQHATDRQGYYRSVAQLGIQAAQALQYAHELGVIHRDIKPSNLLLDRDGRLHITDFGLARIQADQNLTMTGDIVGTMRYMSPEQLDGMPHVDARTDICSLGLTLYEMVAGQPAYSADQQNDLATQVRVQAPKALSKIHADVPSDLETIILKSIDKEAASRYTSANDLAVDLERFINNRPISARRITRIERTRRWIMRNRVVSSLLAAVIALLLILTFESTSVAWRFATMANRQEVGLYARDIRLTQKAIQDGNLIDAEQTLLKWVNAGEDRDLRGFEWYYLWKACHDPAIERTIAHSLPVSDVAFVQGSSQLAVSGWSTTKLWDLNQSADAKPIMELGKSRELELRPIPNTDRILMGGQDRSVREWDTQNGELIRTTKFDLPHSESNICSLSVSDDNKVVAIGMGSESRGHVKIWNRESGSNADCHEGTHGYCYAEFASDGRLFVVAESGQLLVVDTNESRIIGKHDLYVDGIRSVAISADRKRLVLGAYTRRGEINISEVLLWDVALQRLISRIPLGPSLVRSLAISPDGSSVAAGQENGSIHILDGGTLAVVSFKQLHSGSVNALAFSADGSRLASAGSDCQARVWQFDKLTETDTKIELRQQLTHVAGAGFLGNDLVASTDIDGSMFIWDPTTGKVIEEFAFEHHGADMFQLACGHAGKQVAATMGHWPPKDLPGKVQIINVNKRSSHLGPSFEIPNGIAYSISSFSPDDRFLAVCSKTKVVIFDLQVNTIHKELEFGRFVKCTAFSHDGSQFACGGAGGEIAFYDVPNFEKQEQKTIKSGGGICDDVCFSPDDKVVATVDFDNRVKLYSTVSGKLIRRFKATPSFMVIVRFSPDGKRILTCGLGGKLRIWHTQTGEELLDLDIAPGRYGKASFSADGEAIVVGCGPHAIVYAGADPDQVGLLSITELKEMTCISTTIAKRK